MSVPDLLRATDHRPWPLPRGPWVLRMDWEQLAFLHWPVPADALRPHLPAGLELETYDGRAWLGVVPFVMGGVRPRFVPPVPGVSRFPELNLRTYVRAGDRPGVWFFSLDVPHRLPVLLARTLFHLPYFRARMGFAKEGDEVRYEHERHDGDEAFRGTYGPTGPTFLAEPGSLEAFLTERYCLYSADRRGRVFRGDVHHRPWPLAPGTCTLERNALAGRVGIELGLEPPHVLFAERLEVVAWRIRPV